MVSVIECYATTLSSALDSTMHSPQCCQCWPECHPACMTACMTAVTAYLSVIQPAPAEAEVELAPCGHVHGSGAGQDNQVSPADGGELILERLQSVQGPVDVLVDRPVLARRKPMKVGF